MLHIVGSVLLPICGTSLLIIVWFFLLHHIVLLIFWEGGYGFLVCTWLRLPKIKRAVLHIDIHKLFFILIPLIYDLG